MDAEFDARLGSALKPIAFPAEEAKLQLDPQLMSILILPCGRQCICQQCWQD